MNNGKTFRPCIESDWQGDGCLVWPGNQLTHVLQNALPYVLIIIENSALPKLRLQLLVVGSKKLILSDNNAML